MAGPSSAPRPSARPGPERTLCRRHPKGDDARGEFRRPGVEKRLGVVAGLRVWLVIKRSFCGDEGRACRRPPHVRRRRAEVAAEETVEPALIGKSRVHRDRKDRPIARVRVRQPSIGGGETGVEQMFGKRRPFKFEQSPDVAARKRSCGIGRGSNSRGRRRGAAASAGRPGTEARTGAGPSRPRRE